MGIRLKDDPLYAPFLSRGEHPQGQKLPNEPQFGFRYIGTKRARKLRKLYPGRVAYHGRTYTGKAIYAWIMPPSKEVLQAERRREHEERRRVAGAEWEERVCAEAIKQYRAKFGAKKKICVNELKEALGKETLQEAVDVLIDDTMFYDGYWMGTTPRPTEEELAQEKFEADAMEAAKQADARAESLAWAASHIASPPGSGFVKAQSMINEGEL